MTISYRTGSIFDSECQTLVNPVNCVGVMGKGLAAEFKQRFPGMFEQYRWDCVKGYYRLGEIYLHQEGDRGILNFPTKYDWHDPSDINFIHFGLQALSPWFETSPDEDEPPITSIAFPALGCGNGGLDWNDVKPLMERFLADLAVPVEIYEPIEVQR